MVLNSLKGADPDQGCQVLWEDGERIFCRAWRVGGDGNPRAVLVVVPAEGPASRAIFDRLAHEYELKDLLDETWAVKPLELVTEGGRSMLVLEDPGGEPLERLLDGPMAVGAFLRVAIGICKAVGKAHLRDLLHRDIKPANIIISSATGTVKLTGFGVASRLTTLERQSPRSDLYSLGVTLYRMLTGSLPFIGSAPMRLPDSPGGLSTIVVKLLAKTAEERYQTAAGLENDLQRCMTEWQAQARTPASAFGEPAGQLDLTTVVKISDVISGGMVLDRLIFRLMRTAIEHAGAARGLLIVPRGGELQVEAEATACGDDVTVLLRSDAESRAALPESVIRSVESTQESVVLDDASVENPFSADPYIIRNRARSILCVPLSSRRKIIGVLYLENNLVSHAFGPARVAALKVLAL